MRDEHEVGSSGNSVANQVLVFSFKLESVFVDILGILLSDLLRVVARILHLQQILEFE